jgi:hypothetical protein
MEDFVVKETTVWGDAYNKRSPQEKMRCYKKQSLKASGSPFVDHARTYAFKPRSQRGPAREKQTFLVSFAYKPGVDAKTPEEETAFYDRVHAAGLQFYKEECVFRGHPAYKIILYDADVDLQTVLNRVFVHE